MRADVVLRIQPLCFQPPSGFQPPSAVAFSPFSERTIVLNRSLCILLPVHNHQSALVSQVVGVLDVVADLTSRFEILVVDDASSDATFELAVDLSRVYPQVGVLRHGDRRGTMLAVETGLRRTTAEFVVVHDPTGAQFDPSQLSRLWKLATKSAADSLAQITPSVRQGSGRRGFSRSMTQLAQRIADDQRSELESSFGGFRLCRPSLDSAADRRYQLDDAQPQVVAQPIQSAARQRIGRIRHLLRQN
jgi:cellulose synthase/poly-beta-1,6-N-acetylglucosamine synthase-like glycosyltransferase